MISTQFSPTWFSRPSAPSFIQSICEDQEFSNREKIEKILKVNSTFSPFVDRWNLYKVPKPFQLRLLELLEAGNLSPELKNKIEGVMKENSILSVDEKTLASRKTVSDATVIVCKQILALEQYLAKITVFDLSKRDLTKIELELFYKEKIENILKTNLTLTPYVESWNRCNVPVDFQLRLLKLLEAGKLSQAVKNKIEGVMKEQSNLTLAEMALVFKRSVSPETVIACKQIWHLEQFLSKTTILDLSKP
jgi:hypothetical protein